MRATTYRLIISSFLWIIGGSDGLRLSGTVIPLYAILNGQTYLQCRFQLGENEALYSLKWYKDGQEFFRWKPSDEPKSITTFPLGGVNVNLNRSSVNNVHLETIGFLSKGRYKCEVSADAPTFQTLSEEHYMDIMILPANGPKIKGIHPWYNLGENFVGNCTFENTFPRPSLIWSINEVEIDKDKCDCIFEESHTTGKALDGTKLYSSLSRLHFHLGSHYFRDGALTIECKALYPNSSVQLKDVVKTSVKSGLSGLRFADLLSKGDQRLLSNSLLLLPIILLLSLYKV